MNRYASSNAVQIALCRSVMANGADAYPRNLATKELLGVSFVLTRPRNRVTTIPERGWNPALAIAELAWNLRSERSVEPLAFYVPRWREFADERGELRGSCYGASIFGRSPRTRSQWEQVRTLLSEDHQSRRGVLSLRRELDVSATTNDLSCTNTIQFIARDGRLHAFVNMRSNDVIWGVPYDLFLFSTLQELMALELSLDLGDYHHYASSMHIYERHFKIAQEIARVDDTTLGNGTMPPIKSVDSVMRLACEEAELRNNKHYVVRPRTDYERFCLALLKQSQALAA